ncbi:MAG: hypothetical protein JRJ02_01710 [Deltaproteobacteria bacterium]|nr:hypothetical protein [Deltaproteobacteria bacterium]
MVLRKFLLLINIFLTGLILWMAANIIMPWVSSKHKGKEPKAEVLRTKGPGNEVSRTSRNIKYYQKIIDHDIFKTKKGAPKPLEPKADRDVKEVKVSDLDLKLKGTVIGQNRESCAVIFDGSTKKEDFYYLNNFVQDARIVRILSDKVILSKEGKEEALVMSYESEPASKITRPKRQVVKKRPTKRRKPVKRPKRRPRVLKK